MSRTRSRLVQQFLSLQLMNLAQLSSIHITVDCIAFARHGAGTLPTVATIKPAVQLTTALPQVVIV